MEEVQFLDEELQGLVVEIQEKYDDLKKTDKKLTVPVREDKIAYIQDRIARAKDVLANYRVELREVLRESGREDHAVFEAKGKTHNQAVNKLLADTEIIKVAADKRELIKGAKKKKGKNEPEVDPKNQVISEGKKIQEKSTVALDRTSKLVEEMAEVGCETNINLKRQTEQMSNTNADVVGVQNEMTRASKLGRDIARRLATDKLIMCLVLVLVGAIVAIIVGKTVGFNVVSAAVLDCLKSGLSNDKCLNVTVPDIIPGRGPGGGSNGGGSTPAPRSCGEHLHKKYFPDDQECQQFGYIEKGILGVNGDCGDYTTVLNTTNCTFNFCNDTTTTPALTTTTTSPPQTTPTPSDTNQTNSTTTTPEPTTTPPPTTTPTPCQMETCMFCFFIPRPIITPPPTTTPPPVNETTNATTTTAPENITTTPTGKRLLLLDAVLATVLLEPEGEGGSGSSARYDRRQR